MLQTKITMRTKTNLLASNGEETRLKTLLRKHPQSFLQNMLSGLLSRAPTNPNN
jgi:hypothetical protein